MKISKSFLIFLVSFVFFSCGSDSGTKVLKHDSRTIDSLITQDILKADILSKDSLKHIPATELIISRLKDETYTAMSDSMRAKSHHKLGTYYYREKLINQSLSQFDTAIIFWQKETNESSKIAMANSFYVKAVCFEYDDNFRKALLNIQKANELMIEIPNQNQLKGKYLSKTALYFLGLREKTKAYEYLVQAEKLIEKNNFTKAQLYFNFARLFESESKLDKAVDYLNKAIEVYRISGGKRELSMASEVQRLSILMNDKSYQEKKKLTLDFISSFEPSTKYLILSQLTLTSNLAYYALENGEIIDSQKYYLETLKMANELSSNLHTLNHALAYEGLGDIKNSTQNYDEALAFYQQAIQCLSIGFDSKDINSLPNLKDHAIIHEVDLERIIGFKIGALNSKFLQSDNLEDLKAVFIAYQSLDLIWTQMRQGYKAAMTRYNLVEKNIADYEKATNIALELYRRTKNDEYLNEAYRFASKNKAIVMLDGLQDEEAKFANIDSRTLANESKLKKEIYDLDSEIFELSNGDASIEAINEIRKVRFEKSMKYDQLITQLEKDYPNYYQLKYSTNSYVGVESQKKLLPDGAAVIEYFVGVDSIYTFAFTNSSTLKTFAQAKNKKVNESLDQYSLMIKNTNDYSVQEFSDVSHEVYNLLLADVLNDLESGIERLFIIPDNKLMQISFDVLLTEKIMPADNGDWTNPLPYLLRKYSLSYSYSNQLLFDEEKTNRLKSSWSSSSSYLGFGLEYDDFTLSGLGNLQPTEIDTSLTRGMGKLIYSVDEIKESSSIMKGNYFVNENATKSKFINKSEKANIIHLAMHGFVVKKKPMNSGLIFTRQSEDDDFILKASDLYTMKLKADLAVLSACHTGDGLIKRGEGIRSIARAFNYAGCPNVTASLWAAPDLSTKKIILEFYKNLKKEQSIDVALQNAKLTYLDQCQFNSEALPHLWAHLVTIGDTAPFLN